MNAIDNMNDYGCYEAIKQFFANLFSIDGNKQTSYGGNFRETFNGMPEHDNFSDNNITQTSYVQLNSVCKSEIIQ